jgi:hypothetical protein
MDPVVEPIEAPLFDVLRNQSGPYVGFGDPLPDSPARTQRFQDAMQNARIGVADGFTCDLADARLVPVRLGEIIRQMWATGWCPKRDNVALFACDFGLVLTAALMATLGGTLVPRSEREVSHLSIWWPVDRIEAFPFHHVLKCLLEENGHSIPYFFSSLSALVAKSAKERA